MKTSSVLIFTVNAACADLTDASTLPSFPCADLATLIFVLSAIQPEKQEATLANLARLIKPNGLLYFRDYGALDFAMIRFGRGTKIGERFYARQDGTRAYYFYVEELKALAERAGFECEMCEYLHKKTTNYEKALSVDRVFIQGRFRRRCEV